VSGNSGSPVLNLEQEVIGIASFVKFPTPSAMKVGTRFEDRTRRFCFRLSNDEWKAVKWKDYNDRHGKVYLENEYLLSSLSAVFDRFENDLYEVMLEDKNANRVISQWTKAHNNIIMNRDGGFDRDYAESMMRLGRICTMEARRIRDHAKKYELTGFLNDSLEKQAYILEYYNELCTFVCNLTNQ
jgi:hypothetical protein